MVAHVVRFMPPYQKLREWVKQGKFGKLTFLSLSRFSGVPQWGQWKEKQSEYGSSGGALFDLVIHDIDYAYYLMEHSPSDIASFYLPGKLSKHDYVNAIWRFAGSDLTVKIEGGNTFHQSFPFQCDFTAQFEKASLCYSTLKANSIFISTDDGIEEVAAGELNDGYKNQIDYFYKCIRNSQKPTECLPESSLETIRICYKHLK